MSFHHIIGGATTYEETKNKITVTNFFKDLKDTTF